MINHKDKMTLAYNSIHDLCNASRKNLTDNRNKEREIEVEYATEQQIVVKIPFASRQKLAPRYTQDVVMADLSIHIFTKKKRGHVAKSRLKRVPKSAHLFQNDSDSPISPENIANAGDKSRKP